MKKLVALVAAIAAFGFVNSASAADMPVKAPMAPVSAPYNWSGLYVGINGGYGWGQSHWDNAVFPVSNFSVSGGLFGGTIGYNWQRGPWVFGVEGDLDWTHLHGATSPVGICPAPNACTTDNTWLGTARARVGYAWDRTLVYVTGGAAFGNLKSNFAANIGVAQTNTGWTVGGGVEYAFYNNWSVKAEYLFVNLGTEDCGANCGAPAPDIIHLNNISIGRVGLNYRFAAF